LGIIAEEDRIRGAEGIKEVFEKGFAFRALRLLTKDGRKIFYNFSGAVIKDARGNVAGFVGIGSDLTEHKRMEEELKESEFKYRTLVEQIPAVTYIVAADDNNSLVYVSPPRFKRFWDSLRRSIKKTRIYGAGSFIRMTTTGY